MSAPFSIGETLNDLWPATPAGIDKSAVLLQVDPDRCLELSLSKVRHLKLAVEACISTMHSQ
ncbi:hypothetical protein FOPG_19775 [Fusarium oxysporum f. sp. conglutinans race 2 54008]|uniref:Uncharacterized protein n=1 Tax=Fusarium oxysporum f. sp. conglutinans race 2 54008 TaxID=1089457 RepID=X0GVL0_FUSOX|nr:hypothetical protein FOPG_19775 [Fusarium oxysporum f. sp. conglutinans race 2 54008]